MVGLPLNLAVASCVFLGVELGERQLVMAPAVGVRTLTLQDAGVVAREEFADVFSAYHAEVLRLAYLLCGDRDRAEDIVADVFTKLYGRWRRGSVDNPRAYLRRSIVNEVNSKFRRLAVERREAARQRADDRGARADDEQFADQQLVVAALARLPVRQRVAVVLRYYEDLSERETAAALGVSVGTVKSSVSRALNRMRVLIGEELA